MATNPQSNEVLTQNYIRAFTQRGGPGPSNQIRYAGAEEQYMMVGDIANPGARRRQRDQRERPASAWCVPAHRRNH